MFSRGDYDTAVFQAFKEAEISVRRAAELPADLVGVALMRKAFDPKDGPIRSREEVSSERESVAHLFAGAMGYLKNQQPSRCHHVSKISGAPDLVCQRASQNRCITQTARVNFGETSAARVRIGRAASFALLFVSLGRRERAANGGGNARCGLAPGRGG